MRKLSSEAIVARRRLDNCLRPKQNSFGFPFDLPHVDKIKEAITAEANHLENKQSAI